MFLVIILFLFVFFFNFLVLNSYILKRLLSDIQKTLTSMPGFLLYFMKYMWIELNLVNEHLWLLSLRHEKSLLTDQTSQCSVLVLNEAGCLGLNPCWRWNSTKAVHVNVSGTQKTDPWLRPSVPSSALLPRRPFFNKITWTWPAWDRKGENLLSWSRDYGKLDHLCRTG